jgi:CHAT domain-containing protein
LAEHEIVNVPSVSVLAELRDAGARTSASKTVALLADPVFDARDPRVRRSGPAVQPTAAENGVAPGADDLTRAAAEVGVRGFERLPFSRKEADWIEALAPPGQSFKAVDFAASKTAAASDELGRFRIVHFATHAVVNSRHPELSGIVLSLVDQHGAPQDGFLRAHEIYNLKLGADLAVLSACETALGKEIRGEGLLSLTRAFMYAGAPRVVAALWDIKDQATAELMMRFYRGMLQENLRPAEALRAAQVSMWQEPRWEAPYYWAAFTFQGEWR